MRSATSDPRPPAPAETTEVDLSPETREPDAASTASRTVAHPPRRTGEPLGDGQGAEPASPSSGRKKRIAFSVAALVILGVIGYFGWRWWEGRRFVTTDDAQVTGSPTPILAKVSGYVQQVRVSENEPVRSGDTLVVLDASDYRARLAQAEAELRAAEIAAGTDTHEGQAGAQAAAATAAARAARAAIGQAQANVNKTRSDAGRLRPLADQGIISRQAFDAARAAALAAESQLAAAQQNAVAARAQATGARIGVEAATNRVVAMRAAVQQAHLNVDYTTITAPVSGVVGNKNVEVGQLIQSGQPLMAVVPLDSIWIQANFKETQLRDVRPGAPVDIDVDAYPGRTYHGRVQSVAPATGAQFALLPPDNATGNFTKVVQRVPVRIAVGGPIDPHQPLRPGMSVVVHVRKR